MFFWSKFPIVRVALFLVLGILAGVYFPHHVLVVFISLIFAVLLLVISIFRIKAWLIKLNILYGFVLSLIFFAIGYVSLENATDSNNPNHIIRQDSISFYVARVISEPQYKGDFLRMRIEVKATKQNAWRKSTGKILAYFKVSLDSIELSYGDEILVKGMPKQVPPPLNPKEFNYRQYLAFNNIYHQQFINSDQWVLLKKHSRFSIIESSIRVRDNLELILARYISSPQELAIAKALILGNKQELDKPTREVYAMAGAMHVLAVSGLHVGIIYLVLLYALGQGREKVSNPKLVAAVVIPLLWLYAFITGLSPSVLRAVTMFSFLALAQVFNRKSNTFNTLAISAIILLMVNPYMIMSVGFQLSYIAVIGIIFWYPVFEKLLNPTNKVTRIAWQITALSIAAQLTTSPLSALYFHRFPTYFFVSNLLVIPAATIIVWGGLILLSFGALFSTIGTIVGSALQMLIHGLNVSLQWISELPMADIHSLAPSVLDTWLLYGIIITLFLYISTRSWPYFQYVSLIILVFFTSVIYTGFSSRKLKQITFYSVNNSWAIDFIENKSYSVMADSSLLADFNKVDFLITPNRRYYGLKPNKIVPVSHKIEDFGELIVWHGKSILLANPCLREVDLPEYFDFILYKPGQSLPNCYQEQILLRKFVNNNGAKYFRYNLRLTGAIIIDI